MTFEKQVLQRIRLENVRPTPRSFFRMRDIVLWCLLGIFIAALCLGFGMIIFMASGADFSLFEKLGFSTFEKVVYSIPFFWIVASLVLAAIAFVSLRFMKRGYRVSMRQFAFAAAFAAAALGSIIYQTNVARYVDDAARSHLPLYGTVVPINTTQWLDPDHGLLSGIVRERRSDKDFDLLTKTGELWTVTGRDILVPDAFHSGDRVKIIGKRTKQFNFEAKEIYLWRD